MNQNFVIFSAVQITIQQALYWGLVLLFAWDVWIACGTSLLPLSRLVLPFMPMRRQVRRRMRS
jgi:hypothetical protein